MNTTPKYTHIPRSGSRRGQLFASVTLCGRRVNFMALVLNEAHATCQKCVAESLTKPKKGATT